MSKHDVEQRLSNTDRDKGGTTEFLNPKSMLTPGGAGAIIVTIAGALWSTFGCPPEMVALFLSCLFALLVVVPYAAPVWQKATLLVFNTLIVFSMSVGTNLLGSHAFDPSGGNRSSAHAPAGFERVADSHMNLVRVAASDGGPRFALQQKERKFWDPWFTKKTDLDTP
ncbi:MAG: hypothetical protein R3286_10000 [Gammaproteobacteria bacterium]|nr:hypothetical protein [Gammaproteobacteria bacterium]